MSNKPLANPIAFTGQPPPWSLTQLDANFAAIQATINDTLTYSNYFVDQSGVANSIILSIPSTLTVALTAGTVLYVKINNTTTAATTITINSLTAQSIVNQDGSAMLSGQLVAGMIAILAYDGTRFELLGSVLAASGIYKSTLANAVATTVAAKLSQTVSVFDFMTPAQIADVQANTLTLDVSTAIQNAFNAAGVNAVFVPPYKYKLSSGVQFNGISVYSTGFQPSNGPSGAQFVFDLSVVTCVTLGGGTATNQSATLKGINVMRAAGTPPANSVGILVSRTNMAILEDCNSVSHQVCLKFFGDGTTFGITTMVNRVFTGAAYDAHIVIDTMPEVRFNQCRFGMNGTGDQNCLDYIRVQGGSTTNASNGPNTISFSNCQFNQGANSVTNLWGLKNLAVGYISDVELFQMDNCYIESDSVGFFSDATWNTAINVMMTGCHYNPTLSTRQLVSLNAATQINNWKISNCGINAALTIPNSLQTNFLAIDNCKFLGAVSITGLSNSTVNLSDCWYGNGLTLAGAFAILNVIGGGISSGSLTNTATGNVKIDIGPNNGLTAFTPTLLLGGAAVGMTFSLQVGGYQVFGNMVYGQFDLRLTAKGSSTGVITIGALPFAIGSQAYAGGGGGTVHYSINMSGLTAAPILLSIAGGSTFNLYQMGATGVVTIADTNLTNTSQIKGTFHYFM